MRITLIENGEEKTYTSGFISARKFRQAVEMQNKMKNGINVEILDDLVEYIVNAFDRQFTMDELYDRLPSNKLISTVIDVIDEVIGQEVKNKVKEQGQQDFLHKTNQ
jgi:hypothetical protein